MTVLITGIKGCIGAWTARHLLDHGHDVVGLDLPGNMHRLQMVVGVDVPRLTLIEGDILDGDALRRVVETRSISHIVHLAALQVPGCRDHPTHGARVNVAGTVNVFEAARAAGIKHIAYASSVAAYSPELTFEPRTLYGVWKRANEGTARVYRQDHGISSIGLRPYIVYGPGRDFGVTSTPTTAMLAAAAGRDFHIPYGGTAVYHSGRDIGALFARAALATGFGAAALFDPPGNVLHMGAVAAAIEAAAPGVSITFDDEPLPWPHDYDTGALQSAIGALTITPFEEGVAETLDTFRRELAAGRMRAPD